MNRQRRNATHARTGTRIVWRDGTFRVECVGQDAGMKVMVYYGRFMLVQETVDSADMAWQRGAKSAVSSVPGTWPYQGDSPELFGLDSAG